jgi:hypothetical protein
MRERNTPRQQAEHKDEGASGRMPFGIARAPGQRVELVFTLRQGGVFAVTHDLGDAVTAETLERYARELREAIAAGKDWGEFADAWNATGQRGCLQLGDVAGFTVRPSR